MGKFLPLNKRLPRFSRRFLFGLLLLLVPLECAWASDKISETALKAAYTYNFTQFITWPEDSNNTQFRLCVIGAKDEMRKYFDRLNSHTANRRMIEVLYLPEDIRLSDLKSCQLVFQSQPLSSAPLPSLGRGTVLVTFGSSQENVKAGINMYFNRERKLRFSIDLPELRKAGVNVSSQLMKLASDTRDG